jgi:hypothetical protein
LPTNRIGRDARPTMSRRRLRRRVISGREETRTGSPRGCPCVGRDAARWVTGGSITNSDRSLDAGAGLGSAVCRSICKLESADSRNEQRDRTGAARDSDLPLSVRGGGHDWAGRAHVPIANCFPRGTGRASFTSKCRRKTGIVAWRRSTKRTSTRGKSLDDLGLRVLVQRSAS